MDERETNAFIYALLTEAQATLNRALSFAYDGGKGHINQTIWDAHAKCAEAAAEYSAKIKASKATA